ncbi:FtsK/SpoIIIE domain-containing protein [Oerskovia flava]|uniref:FtsK/SpoIIIE domain-containing protein n=1 Tax=Oerskovia flava TaxID=2986422 RepID=UPI00223F3E35|nr:FtsK/SpoIIIE domain-containing protein [Oerskovia sp. JB1-3-2]
MRIKLTLHRPDASLTNVAVTADATASVRDVAEALFAGDPARAGTPVPDRLSLEVTTDSARGSQGRVLSPTSDLIEAGLRSGSTVSIVRVSEQFESPGQDRGPAVAVLRVLEGPDAGREFPLPVGTSYLGRDRDMDIRLSDTLVSKRHARITVGESIEIVDTNSANGLVMGGERMTRAHLTSADTVEIGGTTVSVVALQRTAAAVVPSSPIIEFNRSPRVVARFPERELAPPKPPQPLQPARFPLVAMVAPLLMGVVLFSIRQNVLSVVFIALSPLIMIGNYIDQKITGRRRFRAQVAQFKESVTAMHETIERTHAVERAVRLTETPSVADTLDAVRRFGGLLWTHRPEHRAFLSVRLGLGRGVSRVQVEDAGSADTLPEFLREIEELQAHCAHIDGVPIVAHLRTAGATGIAGPSARAAAVGRGVLVQLAALHSPAELVLTAITSPRSRTEWEWLEWLPHTGSPHSPLDGAHLADNPGAGAALLSRLEDLIGSRGADLDRPAERRGELDPHKETEKLPEPVLPTVVVLVEDDAPVDRSRLTRLVERGPDVGVHVVWVAPTVEQLPAACRTFVLTGTDGSTTGEVRVGRLTFPVECEPVDLATAHELARILAPVVDVGAPVDDDSDLPRSVSYVTLAGKSLVSDPEALVERWRENNSLTVRDGSPPVRRRSDGTLRALVGHSGTEPLHLDLRTQGPHALVGGTTGAGKSEFLQAWVLGMAAAHSPDRVTFLFVDYKGGAAFADCVNLPHTVGLVTDLSPHLVRRALTSLRAELRYREHLLNRKKAKDLISLERTGDPDTPPSLLIVVDEFAALVNEVPEFVDGVVDVAQRGRSLGLHLILATQRPAGVIKDNLRANTNLRVALRMADEGDSTDILGIPMAAHFDPSIPGRGAVKTGPGRITPFQTGYAGGWTTDQPERPRLDVEEMTFGTSVKWDIPAPEVEEVADPGPNDIALAVATISAAARAAAVPEPRKPWLPELATTYDLALLPNPRTDERLLLGVVDDPTTQQQPTVFYEPDRDGNMAIYGTGGSGKSAALRSIAVSAAITARGGPVQVYAIDCGANGLRMLEDLPHVGAVISGDDSERVTRVLRMLRTVVDERSARYASVRAGTIGEYRALASVPTEPRILLLVDGIGAFRDEYEYKSTPWFPVFAAFSQIATDGRQVGVHVVVTGDRPSSVPTSLGSTIQRRLVLRLANADDYMMLGTPKDVLSAASPPGRGVLEGNEVQVAVLGGDANVSIQSREIARLKDAMVRNGVPEAPRVERLPDSFPLDALPLTVGGTPVFGLDDMDIAPVGLPEKGTLLLGGPPSSGRTTALVAMAQAVARSRPGTRVVYFSPRSTPISGLPCWDVAATSPEEVVKVVENLKESVESGRVGRGEIVVLVESITEFTGTPAETPLDKFVQALVRAGQLVVGEAETSTWSQAWSLAKPFKAGRTGLLLTPGDTDGDLLLGTSLGRIRRADFPVGRGFLVVSGRARKMHVALPE